MTETKDKMHNTVPDEESEALAALETDMPEVYDYLRAHIDEYVSDQDGWHAGFAAHTIEHFGLAYDKFEQIYYSIHALAMAKYGELRPSRIGSETPKESA